MRWGLAVVIVLGLSGCGGPELDQLDATLAALRENAGPYAVEAVKPLPAVARPVYRHAEAPNPFQIGEIVAGPVERTRTAHTPEPLEDFSLAELRLVGTLAMGGQRVALVETPGGQVLSAREGGYIGRDRARIAEITAQAVHITRRAAALDVGQAPQVSLSLDAPRHTQSM
ncbi:type IV pilus assembly protein PilP [Vreelandella songnenensis]|uniref:Type IV pilus assembly protein PilP n=1 Tax=Vreelandella songnenensis TaxID=1176243 RepID=A0A2T0V4N8_9GAMM|nr:pilus assembly protein PilP [Halomonas songnenensis]PRY65131.1 type IV pilus assembly protein PilP [Halomonas songnenensis]